ncbi:MAG: transposase, partial [Rhodocyclaceae bacterium]|nr:transposase [Rhodocyclaceae bacterium]
MPMNRVQFQKGLSLPEFMDRYGTEEQCEQALVAARWPGGFVCPVCGVMQSRTS